MVIICTAGLTLKTLHTVHKCVLCPASNSNNKKRLLPYTAFTDWVPVIEMASDLLEAKTEPLYIMHNNFNSKGRAMAQTRCWRHCLPTNCWGYSCAYQCPTDNGNHWGHNLYYTLTLVTLSMNWTWWVTIRYTHKKYWLVAGLSQLRLGFDAR